MSRARLTRRRALGAGGLGLLAFAAPAQAAGEGSVLLGLWRREQAAEFAFGANAGAPPEFARIRAHAAEHVAALATQLAAVGLGTPRRARDVAHLDAAAARLARAGTRAAAAALERELVEVYRAALPALPDGKVAMTVATILASHAQHELILGAHPLAAA